MVSYMHSLLDNSVILFASSVCCKLLSALFVLLSHLVVPFLVFFICYISSYLRGTPLLKLRDCQKEPT